MRTTLRNVPAAGARLRRSALLGCGVLTGLACVVVVAGPVSASAARRSLTPSTTAIGSIGIRLIDGQIGAPNDPRARVYIVDHLAPGTIIQRHVEVSNTTGSTRRVVLYSAAAGITNGSFSGAADRTPNDLSTWTSVVPSALDIPADGRRIATVTITVPSDAAPGEQYGVVWAEARSAPSTAGGIVQVSRVGVRVYLSVGPGGPPAADFTIDSITATRPPHGRPLVLATVHNTGGRALDMAGTLRLLRGPGGLTAGPFPANLGVTLAIGESEPIVIALDKRLPAGPWDALLTLHSGLVERSVRTTIMFPVGVSPAASNRTGWEYPALAGLALVLLGLTGVLVLSRRPRRRPRSRRGAHAPQPSVPARSRSQLGNESQRPGRKSRGRVQRHGHRRRARRRSASLRLSRE